MNPRSDTTVAALDPRPSFLDAVLRVAAGEESRHVREVPQNSNSGPDVDRYLASVGCGPGNAWCCAFVYWCFEQAAQMAGVANPMYKTANCINHWKKATTRGALLITTQDALKDFTLVRPGMIFVINHDGMKGHTGLVEQVHGDVVTTIEGNTDPSRTREGGGVYRLQRPIKEINLGFIAYDKSR